MAQIQSTASLFAHAWRTLTIGAVGLCSMMAFEAIGTGAALATGGLVFSLLHARMPTSAFAGVFILALGIAGLAWAGARRAYPHP